LRRFAVVAVLDEFGTISGGGWSLDESRFQRCFFLCLVSWALPKTVAEVAPLAL
jgi:hypothetical protein